MLRHSPISRRHPLRPPLPLLLPARPIYAGGELRQQGQGVATPIWRDGSSIEQGIGHPAPAKMAAKFHLPKKWMHKSTADDVKKPAVLKEDDFNALADRTHASEHG